MNKDIVNLDEMYLELANAFKASSQLFGELSTPESVQEILRTLATGDQEAFNRIGERLEFPKIGKCLWVRELVTHVIITSTAVDEYYLRNDLTPYEWWLIWQLSMQFMVLIATDKPIPEGPFLESLKEKGLVARRPGSSVFGNLVEMPGPYQGICV